MASYGAEYQHESTSFSLALLLATERLKVIAAVHPGLWHPGVLAKLGRHRRPPVRRARRRERRSAAGSRASSPRSASRGSSTTSATAAPRSSSARCAASGPRTTPSSRGDFYRIRDFSLKPKPLRAGAPAPGDLPGRQLDAAARAMAGRVSDWYFSNGKDFDGVREQLADMRERRRKRGPPAGRGSASTASSSPATPRPRPATRCARSSTRRDAEAVRGLRRRGQAGRAVHRRRQGHVAGLRASRTWSSTTTASAPASSARPSRSPSASSRYKRLGVDLILLGFLHYHEEVEYFGKRRPPDRARARGAGRTRRADCGAVTPRQIRLNAFDMNCVDAPVARASGATPTTRPGATRTSTTGSTSRGCCERGRFDGIFIADVLGVYDVYGGSRDAACATAPRCRSTTRCCWFPRWRR